MIETLINRIAQGRHACLKDNEEPRDVLISRGIEREIKRSADKYMAYQIGPSWEKIMGLTVEWINAPITDISIRTAHGDVRRI